MARLARERLARFGDRVRVQQTDGTLRFDAPSRAFDRFVATYVVNLLSATDIAILLNEAHRLLAREGYLCLVNLTQGTTLPARLVTGLWSRSHTLRPALVGGCRPLQL
jgi:ubiquinone/menaquinone biosynthesis C-methylase UbiE